MCAARVDVHSDQVVAILQGGGTRRGRASYALRDFDAEVDVINRGMHSGTGFSMVRLLLDRGTVMVATREHDTYVEGDFQSAHHVSGLSRRSRWSTMILDGVYGVKPEALHVTDAAGQVAVEVRHLNRHQVRRRVLGKGGQPEQEMKKDDPRGAEQS